MRKLLVNEPRGHADMYGCFVTEPTSADGDLGVLFFHNAGFSTACGHGTIALATSALETGMVEAREPETELVVDAPSGSLPVTVAAGRGGSRRAVPQRAVVRVGPRGSGGRARRRRRVRRRLLRLGARSRRRARGRAARPAALIELGREVKRALEAEHEIAHPEEPELRDVYGVIFWQEEEPLVAAQRHRLRGRRGRPLAVRGGTSARLALLHAPGEIREGETLLHRSIVGTEFRAESSGRRSRGRAAVVTEVAAPRT